MTAPRAYSSVVAVLVVLAICAAGAAAYFWPQLWQTKPLATTGSAPVAKAKTESDLARIKLLSQEIKSLDIRSAPAITAEVQEQLALHGFVMARPGAEVVLTAPVSGYIRAPSNPKDFPLPALGVRENQELFRLEPVLSPVEKTQFQSTLVQLATLRRSIEGELAKASESVTAGQSEHNRTAELVKSKLRGEQDLEQATARLKMAQADFTSARDRLKLFDSKIGSIEKDQSQPFPILAPLAAKVLLLSVSPGQFVQASSPLVTLADLDRPWLHVPVSEQDLQRINYHDPATLLIGQPPSPLVVLPVGLVPRVDPLRHTADVLYDLGQATAPKDKRSPVFARDQMLNILLPLNSKRRETVVPSSAIVHDANGSAWIYLELTTGDDRLYQRRRVEVGPRVSQGQVIRPALSASDRVVISGAAALYSSEFYRPPLGQR